VSHRLGGEEDALARIELEAVQAGLGLQGAQPRQEPRQGLGVAHVEQAAAPLPPRHQVRLAAPGAHQVAARGALGKGLRGRLEERDDPGRDGEAEAVQLVHHPARIGEARRVEAQVAVAHLPAVVNLQHVIGVVMLADLAREVQHGLLIHLSLVARPRRPGGAREEFGGRGAGGPAQPLDEQPVRAGQVVGEQHVVAQVGAR